jgi:hypothetical protein
MDRVGRPNVERLVIVTAIVAKGAAYPRLISAGNSTFITSSRSENSMVTTARQTRSKI